MPTTERTSAILITALVWTMLFSTIQLYTIAVLASEVRDDLGISRTQLGIIGAVNTAVGAMASPFTGGVIDKIGARAGAIGVLIGSGLGMLATAGAQTIWPMLGASAIAGLAQSGGNPATNKLIALHVPGGRRGAITGIKQSGVTLSLFLCGSTLPAASALIGWRSAAALYGCAAFALALVVWWKLPADPRRPQSAVTAARAPLPPFVRRITWYALMMGVTTAGLLRFLALFAEEELGYNETTAGLAASVVGLAGIAARIIWGRLAEHHVGTRRALTLLAVLSAVTAWLLAVAPPFGAWLIWPIAVLTAFSAVAWNVVGNLAIIRGAGPAMAGRATGVMLFGFLAGLSIGAPMTGAIVDATGDYWPAWLAISAAALAAAVIVALGPEPPVP